MPVEHEGDQSPLLEAALKIGEPQEPSGDEATKDTTPAQRQPEPQTGSYESFLSTFGRAMK